MRKRTRLQQQSIDEEDRQHELREHLSDGCPVVFNPIEASSNHYPAPGSHGIAYMAAGYHDSGPERMAWLFEPDGDENMYYVRAVELARLRDGRPEDYNPYSGDLSAEG